RAYPRATLPSLPIHTPLTPHYAYTPHTHTPLTTLTHTTHTTHYPYTHHTPLTESLLAALSPERDPFHGAPDDSLIQSSPFCQSIASSIIVSPCPSLSPSLSLYPYLSLLFSFSLSSLPCHISPSSSFIFSLFPPPFSRFLCPPSPLLSPSLNLSRRIRRTGEREGSEGAERRRGEERRGERAEER